MPDSRHEHLQPSAPVQLNGQPKALDATSEAIPVILCALDKVQHTSWDQPHSRRHRLPPELSNAPYIHHGPFHNLPFLLLSARHNLRRKTAKWPLDPHPMSLSCSTVTPTQTAITDRRWSGHLRSSKPTACFMTGQINRSFPAKAYPPPSSRTSYPLTSSCSSSAQNSWPLKHV